MQNTLLKIENLSKVFGGVRALDAVSLTINKGEIHCLAGENGSGKSTLIKVVSGFYKPEGGVITIDGKQYGSLSITNAIRLGIQVIYQDFSIFPNLTVAENIAMNYELYNRKKLVSWSKVREIAQESMNHIGISIPLEEKVENLSVADKQLVAIARSILYNARLIIMDEPTSALTRKEVDKLFRVVRQLQSEGVSILFVSHKLDEVFEIADKFTVLRNGKLIVTDDAQNIDSEKFIYYMTGRKIEEEYYVPEAIDQERTLFEVRNLYLKNGFEGISFAIHAGEILGITGLLGSGRTELAKALFGLYAVDMGSIYVDGEEVQIKTPQDAIRHRIAYVPEDRLTEGLFLSQSVKNNLVVSHIDALLRWGRLDRRRMDAQAAKWIDELAIKVHKLEDPIQTLSGGNQQKAVLGKWLGTSPRVLILNGPTVGVDIGSKFDIHAFLRELAARAEMAIIIISDDISEVLKNCNRILIIDKGRITGEYANTELNEHSLMQRVTAGEVEEA